MVTKLKALASNHLGLELRTPAHMAGSGWVNKPPTLSRAYSPKLLTISRQRREREAAADAGCEQAMMNLYSACYGNHAHGVHS